MNNLQRINPGTIAKADQARINTLYNEAMADNTRRAYATDWRDFEAFCQDRGIDPLSAGVEVIAAYITDLHDAGRKISTIRRKVSTVSSAYAEAGLPRPTDNAKIRKLLKGTSNTQRKAGIRTEEAAAISLQQLEAVCTSLMRDGSAAAIRDRAILVTGFFGAFRRSELAGITWEQVAKDNNGFTVELTAAKNIKDGETQVKAFPFRSNIAVCPVRALEAWQRISGATTGPVFTVVSKLGRMEATGIYDKIIDRLVKRYFGNDYSAHSLRAGFITEAGRKNISAVSIAHQTGHKTLQMIQKYTRFANAWEGNAVTGI